MSSGARPADALLAALAEPRALAALDAAGWSRLVAQARASNLLGALAAGCRRVALEPPAPVRRHLDGALHVARRQRMSVGWEVHELQAALGMLGVPVVLLKGAAYVMAGHPIGAGRTFGDIDVLVPRDALDAVERRLMIAGWASAKADAYDQRYYREWMHELPPMQHIRRRTVIDVHHTILPLTARHAPDPARLIARARPLDGLPAMHVPAPEDLLAHSLTHLMHEGELNNGLRDLHDIDEMGRHFGAEPAFWPRFAEAVVAHDLAAPVACGLHLAQRWFETPVPESTLATLAAAGGPPPRWLEPVYRRAVRPKRADGGHWADAFAREWVYVRAHALRMPPGLLARHLAIKAWRGWRGEAEPA